jgi:hypothetical protein
MTHSKSNLALEILHENANVVNPKATFIWKFDMFYGNRVQETRKLFFSSWEKFIKKEELTPLEQQIVTVIMDHPEYHALLEHSSAEVESTYFPEMGQTNPFLHMGLHLAVRDQIATDRPPGIRSIFQELLKKQTDRAHAEHFMMDKLAECLWVAQRNQCMPNEMDYLQACKETSS